MTAGNVLSDSTNCHPMADQRKLDEEEVDNVFPKIPLGSFGKEET